MKPISFVILGTVTSLCLAGCAANQSSPAKPHTTSRSAGGVNILSVDLTRDKDGWSVHGLVQRTPGYQNSPFRHLDVEVINAAGDLLSRQPINFFPNPIFFSSVGPGRAAYSVRLAQAPPLDSTVRVVVDCVSLSNCPLARIGS